MGTTMTNKLEKIDISLIDCLTSAEAQKALQRKATLVAFVNRVSDANLREEFNQPYLWGRMLREHAMEQLQWRWSQLDSIYNSNDGFDESIISGDSK